MGNVYACSDLTISVAAGKDCASGLFMERSWAPSASLRPAELKCRDSEGSYGTCFFRGRLETSKFNEPADLRGWTLQESLLSRKLVTFGTAQTSWACSSGQ